MSEERGKGNCKEAEEWGKEDNEMALMWVERRNNSDGPHCPGKFVFACSRNWLPSWSITDVGVLLKCDLRG